MYHCVQDYSAGRENYYVSYGNNIISLLLFAIQFQVLVLITVLLAWFGRPASLPTFGPTPDLLWEGMFVVLSNPAQYNFLFQPGPYPLAPACLPYG